MDAEGIDLNLTEATDFATRLVQPEMLDILRPLQKAFHSAYPEGEISLERAARQFISEGLKVPPQVILEGFSFFRPLQLHFIRRCHELGARVTFIHAYRPEQSFGFEALNHSYDSKHAACFAIAEEQLITDELTVQSDLEYLQNQLFAKDSKPRHGPLDPSLTVEAYPHRHAEIRSCVERIAELLQKNYQPRDIRIVTRDAETYRSLLIEEVELFSHQQRVAGLEPTLPLDLFKIPLRQLLLTPLGRFVLTLYEIWSPDETEEADKIQLKPEHFITILSSGLLSVLKMNLLPHQLQSSAKRFAACQDQVFANCRTVDQWNAAFAELSRIRQSSLAFRLPSAGVSLSDVENWQAVLILTKQLCERLFNTNDKSVAEHIKSLQSMLKSFDVNGMANQEKELLEKINSALSELESIHSTPISTVQFREVVNGLVSERNAEDTGATNQIAIIAPEGLDNSQQHVVFFLGADSMRLPRAYQEPWPFYDQRMAADLAQDRYLFLAALRATIGKPDKPARFYLSYPQTENNQVLQPSPYFEEVMYLLGLRDVRVYPVVDHCPIEEALPAEVLGSGSKLTFTRDFEQDQYHLAELLQYDLCPYRYQLERLSTQGSFFTTTYQLRYLAVGVWLHLILDAWQKDGVEVNKPVDFLREARRFRNATKEEMRKLFLGFSEQDRIEVGRELMDYLKYWAHAWESNQARQVNTAPAINIPLVNSTAQHVKVDLNFCVDELPSKQGGYLKRVAFVKDVLTLNWLRFGRKPDENAVGESEATSVTQYQKVSEYQRITTKAFRQATWDRSGYQSPKAQVTLQDLDHEMEIIKNDLQGYIEAIEQEVFEKRPGDHCLLCPNNPACLGVVLPSIH